MYGKGWLEMCQEEINTKKCIQCGEELPLTEEYFYKEESYLDGFRNKCKDCIKSRYKPENFDFDIWYNNKINSFKNKWKYDDLKWIYDNYDKIDKQMLINKFPNSNYKTIHNIICQWDVRKIEKNDDWSKEDIQFLTDNYPNMPQEKLQDHFPDRTWYAITRKANKLGVKRDAETLFLINSEAHKGYVMPEETRKKLSRVRRGSNSVNWKGGLTPLHPYFRSILYEWKMDSLKDYDYKCAFTGENNGDLQIHHANENFSDIIIETLNLLDLPIHNDMLKYSDEEILKINKTFLDLNYKHGLGIPLAKQIHKLFHVLYGLTNNTKKQFEEFRQRFINGEFKDILKVEEKDIKKKSRNKKKNKRLTPDEVRKIRNLLDKGFPITYISKEYGTQDVAIYNIKTNRSWKNIV